MVTITIREFALALPALPALAAHDAPDAPHNVVRSDEGKPVITADQFVFKSSEAQQAFEAGMAAIMDEVSAMNLSMPLSVAWLVREPAG